MNNSATAATIVGASADLQLTLHAAAVQAEIGVPVAFTASSENHGPSDAQDVQITITLDASLGYSSHTASGASCTTPASGAGGAIVCTWSGATPIGMTRTLQVLASANAAGTRTVAASSSATTPDPSPNGDAVTFEALAATAPSIAKAFQPPTILPFGTSTLTITLTNPNSFAITGATFTDTYPAGLTNATPANPSTTCGGTVVATNGGGSLALTGGTIPANGSCVVNVLVTATPGNYANVIPNGGLTSANAPPSTGGATTAALTVGGEIPTLSAGMLALLSVLLGTLALIAIRRV
ncbi:MAG: hypothetical protein JOZ54_07595 [Acidobacteria bacterium]|nr:hypothetical protein [Acidobacteriota bacterium]